MCRRAHTCTTLQRGTNDKAEIDDFDDVAFFNNMLKYMLQNRRKEMVNSAYLLFDKLMIILSPITKIDKWQ